MNKFYRNLLFKIPFLPFNFKNDHDNRNVFINGMSCEGCVENVRTAIRNIPEVIEAQIHLSKPQAIISMKEKIPEVKLQQAISAAGNYHIAEIEETKAKELAVQPQKKLDKVLGLFHRKKECCK